MRTGGIGVAQEPAKRSSEDGQLAKSAKLLCAFRPGQSLPRADGGARQLAVDSE
jgi:hypothetical protein